MPFPAVFAGAAEGDAVVHDHVVANLGGFTYYYAHAVVNKHPAANASARVNLYAGEKAREVRQKARQKVESRAIEGVRQTVKPNSVEPRITQDYFRHALSGGVVLKHGGYVFAKVSERVRHGSQTTLC
jgi:hypothetical protein